MRMNGKKVALGLSGGVDSAVSAKLLLEQGYDVTGVYLECYRETGCRADGDRQDALQVALDLGIPFLSLDFREIYRQKVLAYFYQSYQDGQTPNPDLLCNLEVKFGPFYDWAMANGFDFVATGHYARIKKQKLYTAADKNKDQTYFLALVEQKKWAKVIFPLGDYEKTQVRCLAEKWHLSVANKPDSTGVCFVGEMALPDLLSLQVNSQVGQVVRLTNNSSAEKYQVIGEHRGAQFYTIGQRHGFKITSMNDHAPQYYVIGKDVKRNLLIVGEKEAAFSQKFTVKESATKTWLKTKAFNQVLVRVRHQGEILACKISPGETVDTLQVNLAKPVFGLSPGQFAVFYQIDPDDKTNFFCLGAAAIIE